MPRFEKSSASLVARFDATLGAFGAPDVTRRQMFGYPCAFVGGHMTTGLFAESWFVRLDDAGLDEALRLPGGRPFAPMPGRPMRGYAILPDTVVSDDAAVAAWVARSIAFARTLPPKE